MVVLFTNKFWTWNRQNKTMSIEHRIHILRNLQCDNFRMNRFVRCPPTRCLPSLAMHEVD